MTSNDLSALADATATATGGAVSIMDPYGYVIAYSSVFGQPIDDVRRDGILGKRVPEKFLVHHRVPTFRAERTVRKVDVPGTLPRLAIAVGRGKDHLGSIWSIAPEQPVGVIDTYAVAALERAAEAAVPLLLARKSPARGGSNRVLAMLTDEDAVAYDSDYVVVAAEMSPVQTDSTLEQLVGLVELLLARAPRSGSVVMDRTVYLLRPGNTSEDFTDEVEAARQRASTSLGVPVTIGISEVCRNPRMAAEQARRVLDVVAGQARTVAYKDARSLIALSNIGAALSNAPLSIPAVDAMLAHDAAEGTNYAETVLAFLEHESNVALAASSMYLHANTFRYRLRRTKEMFGLDLDDADTRLLVWLALRLGR